MVFESETSMPRLMTPNGSMGYKRIMNEVKLFMLSNPLSDPNRQFTLKFDEANLSLCTVEVVSIILTNLLAFTKTQRELFILTGI